MYKRQDFDTGHPFYAQREGAPERSVRYATYDESDYTVVAGLDHAYTARAVTEEVEQMTAGRTIRVGPTVDGIYIGTVAAADDTLDLSTLMAHSYQQTGTRLRVPTDIDGRYLVIAQDADAPPLSSLTIGGPGVNILPTFIRHQMGTAYAGASYTTYVSGVPYAADAAGQTVTVQR